MMVLQRMYVDQEARVLLPHCNESKTPSILKCHEVWKKALSAVCICCPEDEKATVQLLGSGVTLREVIKAAKILREEYQIQLECLQCDQF